MTAINRTIQELLVDYAGALRDGCIPEFLKSLTQDEGKIISKSKDFWKAAEVVRTVNTAGFADKAVTPNVSLFISRVNAEIVSRLKKAKAPSHGRSGSHSTRGTKTTRTGKEI